LFPFVDGKELCEGAMFVPLIRRAHADDRAANADRQAVVVRGSMQCVPDEFQKLTALWFADFPIATNGTTERSQVTAS